MTNLNPATARSKNYANLTRPETTDAASPRFGAPKVYVVLGLLLFFGMVAGHWKTVDSAIALFQVKAGSVAYNTGQIPNRDIFSAASRVNEWVFFEWLWSAGAAAAYRMVTWLGLSTLNVILAFLLYSLMLFRARQRESGWLEALSLTIVTGVALLPGFQPESTYGILPVYLLSLIITEARHRWPMVVFPALVTLWTNMHPGVLLAFAAPIAYLAIPARNGDREPRRKLYLAVIIAAGLLAVLINPHSVRIISSLWDLASNQAASAMAHFSDEMHEISFLLRVALVWVFFILAMAGRKLARRDGLSIIVLVASTFWLSPSAVNFLLIYLAAPTASSLTQILKRSWSTARVKYLSGASLLLVCLGWSSITAFTTKLSPETWGSGIRPHAFPETAASRLAAIPLRSSILNLKEHGGYITWRLWPSWKVTADHRNHVYGAEFESVYEGIWAGQPGWEAYLSLWRVHAVLGDMQISNRYASHNLYFELAKSDDWSAVYWDRDSILYIKSNIELESTNLSKFRRLKPGLPWNELMALQKSPEDWQELKADLRRALIDDPDNEIALEFLKRAEAAD